MKLFIKNVNKKIISCYSLHDPLIQLHKYPAVIQTSSGLMEQLIYSEIFPALNQEIIENLINENKNLAFHMIDNKSILINGNCHQTFNLLHKKVTYYEKGENRNDFEHGFYKLISHKDQNEYRFLIDIKLIPMSLLDKYDFIYTVNFPYIKKIFLKEKWFSKSDKLSLKSLHHP